jgi:hypothetical protein
MSADGCKLDDGPFSGLSGCKSVNVPFDVLAENF